MKAATGAACSTMNIGITSHSPVRHRPQTRAEADAEKGGQDDAEDQRLQRRQIGLRQAAVGHQPDERDQRVGKGRKGEADRYQSGDLPDRGEERERDEPKHDRPIQQASCLAVARAGGEADGLAFCSNACRHRSGRLLLAELGDGAVDRRNIPEILDLERGGIAFDLAGRGEEGEVAGRRFGSAAVQRQGAGFGGLLVVFGDLGIGFGAEVGQQLVFVAELDRDGRDSR